MTSAFEKDNILALMKTVNTYSMEHPWRKSDRNWIRATFYTGVMEAYHATGNPMYLEQAKNWAEKHQWKVGTERSGFNRLFCAMTWLELYLLEPDQKKIASTIAALKEDVPYSPAGAKVWYGHAPGPWDKPVYADSLYAAPVLAMLHKATGDQQYLDILNTAFWDITDKIFDTDLNLYYRDPGYIGKTTKQGKKIIWSRGNGWVFAMFPRLLKQLPQSDPNYPRYVALFKQMAAALATCQQDDGFWRANLADPLQYPMPESSGTAFFTAGFAWGIREGILDKKVYLPVVIRGWQALASAIHPSGRMGWVQPVDGQPRPAHPGTTQEYATGLFLFAASQVSLLVKDKIITPAAIRAALYQQNQMLPPAALKATTIATDDHPLSREINLFVENQKDRSPKPTGLTKKDYLKVIADQVKGMRGYQNDAGQIIDPVMKREMYYSTPCYAHSVAILLKAGYTIDDDLKESGMKALDVSVAALAAGKAPGGHGDFFIWPIMFAYELFDGVASPDRKAQWKKHLSEINPKRSYSRNYISPINNNNHGAFYKAYRPRWVYNWNLVNVSGEWLRSKHGFTDPWYADFCMTMQLPNFTPLGQYSEKGEPLAYDLFSRHYLVGMLQRGYDSFLHTTYRKILWRGAWTSLFMQSPFGECPTGYRSSSHIWNEAEQAVVFESYAAAYAKAGRMAEAGAFKRAARLSLQSIQNWIRPDGTGYAVKNRAPIEAKHGYERYTAHSCYNMLATSMLAQAWQFADDSIEEKACPAEVGGFVFESKEFHKVFANAAGNYLEYDTRGDQQYNPTGIIRIHLKDGHPQLGPSDGCAQKFSGKGQVLAVGPSWMDANGKWVSLAKQTKSKPTIKVIEETADRVQFNVRHEVGNPKVVINQGITIASGGVIVENTIKGDSSNMRISYPMLVSDGKSDTVVKLNGNVAEVTLDDKTMRFEIVEPKACVLKRTGKKLKHRNGYVEEVTADAASKRMVYRISSK